MPWLTLDWQPAIILWVRGDRSIILNPTRRLKTAAKKAIQINGDLADGHAALALDLTDLDWDWTAAGNEFHQALELNPNSGSVHSTYALYLARLGRSSEAIAEAQRGVQLDPISLVAHHTLAYCYYGARQYDRALDQIRKAFELNLISPNSWIHWDLGIIYCEKGSYEKAIQEFRILGDNAHTVGHLGNTYARAGQIEEARQAVSKLKGYIQKDGLGTYEIALVYAGLDDKDEAFAWLEKSYEVRDKGLTFLKLDPGLDPLRADPRFQSLLRRVGLAN